MRILFVAPYYPFPPSVGGVETIVREVSYQLVKMGHDVYIVTTNLEPTEQKPVKPIGYEIINDIRIYKLPTYNLSIGYANVLKGLKEIVDKIKPEIIHAHNLHPHIFQLSLWKAKFHYKLVTELHFPAIELDYLLQRAVAPLVFFFLRKFDIYIDLYISHTNIEKHWLTQLGINSYKISVIPFPGVSDKYLQFKNNSKKEYDILYLGRIVQRKGIHILLESLRLLKAKYNNIKTNIAGPYEVNYMDVLKKTVRNLGLEENVNFLGKIEEKKKAEFMIKHKFFVLPSLRDYTPNILIEAQALGLPVIATYTGNIPAMLENLKTGILVRPNDYKSLYMAIDFLYSHNDILKKMSYNARKFARKFNIKELVKNMIESYEKIISY